MSSNESRIVLDVSNQSSSLIRVTQETPHRSRPKLNTRLIPPRFPSPEVGPGLISPVRPILPPPFSPSRGALQASQNEGLISPNVSVIQCPLGCSVSYHSIPENLNLLVPSTPQIVASSPVELSPEVDEMADHNSEHNVLENDVNSEVERQSQTLRRKRECIVDMMTELTEDDIDAVSLLTVENDLNKIQDKKDQFKVEVRNFLEEYNEQLDTQTVTSWNNSINTLSNDVKTHARKIRTKVHSLLPLVVPLTAYEKAQLDLQEQQIALMQQQDNLVKDNGTNSHAAKVFALAKRKHDSFMTYFSSIQLVTLVTMKKLKITKYAIL